MVGKWQIVSRNSLWLPFFLIIRPNVLAHCALVKLLASGPHEKMRSSVFQRWFRIENRTIYGEVMVICVKGV